MVVVSSVLFVVAVVCAVCDARTGLIPNALTLPAVALAAAGGAVDPLIAAAALVCALPYAAAFAMRACGGGDVKLAVVVGAACATPAAALSAVVLAAVGTLVIAGVRRRRTVRHGPALTGAGLLVAVVGLWMGAGATGL